MKLVLVEIGYGHRYSRRDIGDQHEAGFAALDDPGIVAQVGPAGMPDDARQTIAAAVAEILNDKETKVHQFIAKAFGPPLIVSGAELDALVSKEIDDNKKMLEKLDN